MALGLVCLVETHNVGRCVTQPAARSKKQGIGRKRACDLKDPARHLDPTRSNTQCSSLLLAAVRREAAGHGRLRAHSREVSAGLAVDTAGHLCAIRVAI